MYPPIICAASRENLLFAYAKTKAQINYTADQGLCFHYKESTIPLLPKPKISNFCDCTAQFMSNLVGNPKDKLSYDMAHFKT